MTDWVSFPLNLVWGIPAVLTLAGAAVWFRVRLKRLDAERNRKHDAAMASIEFAAERTKSWSSSLAAPKAEVHHG